MLRLNCHGEQIVEGRDSTDIFQAGDLLAQCVLSAAPNDVQASW